MRNKKHFDNERRKRWLAQQRERKAARRGRSMRIRLYTGVATMKPVVREHLKFEKEAIKQQRQTMWGKFRTAVGRMFGRGK